MPFAWTPATLVCASCWPWTRYPGRHTAHAFRAEASLTQLPTPLPARSGDLKGAQKELERVESTGGLALVYLAWVLRQRKVTDRTVVIPDDLAEVFRLCTASPS